MKDWWLFGAAFCLAACQRTGATHDQGARAEPSKAGTSGTPQCFSVTAESSSTSTRSLFDAKHCQGGGVTWAGLLNVLVQRRGKTHAVEQPAAGWTGDVRILSWKAGAARFAIDDEGSAALFCTDAADLLNEIRSETKLLNESSAELERAMAEADPQALECLPEGLSPEEVLKRASPSPPVSPAEASARAESLARLRALLNQHRTWCWTPGAARFTPWKGAFNLDADGRVSEPGKSGRLSSMTLGSGPDCAELLKQLDRDLDGVGETTAVVVLVVGGSVFGASVGDSGAWRLAADGVIDLTAAQHPKPLLGSGRATPVVFGPSSGSNARILLGSDGLFKYVPHDLIREIASTTPLGETAAALVRAARLSGGALRDDIAVIVAG